MKNYEAKRLEVVVEYGGDLAKKLNNLTSEI